MSFSGLLKPRKIKSTLSLYYLILAFIYLSSYIGKAFNSIFFKTSILVQVVLHFSNSFLLSIRKGINLLFLSLSPSLTHYSNTKTNSLTTNGLLSRCQIIYLELVFVSTNF